MSYVDILRTANSVLLNKAEKSLNHLERHGPAAIRAIADAAAGGDRLRRLALELGVRAAIAALRESIEQGREMLAILRELNELGGSPDRLRAVASILTTLVRDPLDALAPGVRRDDLQAMVPSVWQDGDAHWRYRDGFDGQQQAVEDAAAAAAAVVRSLDSMADGIEAFYIQLSVEIMALVSAIVGFVVGVITAATVVGAVAAIAAFVGAVAAGIAVWLTTSSTHGEPVGDTVRTLSWPAADFADS